MHSPQRPWLLSALLLLLPVALACGDVITLDDGSVLEGDIVSPADAAVIDLRIVAGGVVAIQHIDRHHIVRIDRGPSPHQRLVATLTTKASALAAAGSAEEWLDLAHQALSAGEHSLSRTYAWNAVAQDRHLVEAHAFLGEVRQNGIWMLPREAAVARGEVWYDGHWMSWGERQTLVQRSQQAAHDAAQERQRLVDAQREQRLSQELETAEYGSPCNDPFQSGYVGTGSEYGYVSNSNYYGSYGVLPIIPLVGGGWYGRHYHHGFYSGLNVVISGGSRQSQWALHLQW